MVYKAARRSGLEVDEVDIDSDDDLVADYGVRIPVVLGPRGEVLAEGVIRDGRALRRAFRGLRQPR